MSNLNDKQFGQFDEESDEVDWKGTQHDFNTSDPSFRARAYNIRAYHFGGATDRAAPNVTSKGPGKDRAVLRSMRAVTSSQPLRSHYKPSPN